MLFLFDENLSNKIAESLDVIENARGSDRVISTMNIPELGRGATDQEILTYALTLEPKCFIVTADRDFRKRQLYSQILSQKNVGLFWIRFPKGKKGFFDKFKFIVNSWESIKEKSNTLNTPIRYVLETNKKLRKIQ